MNIIPKGILKQLFENRQLRKETLGKDILWFTNFYFPDYLKYPTAPFQKEMLRLIQNLDHKFIEILAFRGSAKSTYCSLVLPTFSIVGKHEKKHILLVSQVQSKSEDALMNIRMVWESSKLLMKDFGPIRHETDPWNQTSLVFGHYGAKISAVSVEKSIRGAIHGRYRPDLIICDDIEDVASSKSFEAREKLWQFINAELIFAGDLPTNYLFTGNLVHEDSVMVRLKKAIDNRKLDGICKEYPLVDDEGCILWKGKYPDMRAIEALKRTSPSEIDFLREYMLKIVPPGNRIIYPEDIHRYDEDELKARADFRYYLILMDSAVSEEKNADNTAIYVLKVYGSSDKLTFYIQPHPINEKLTWPKIIEKIKEIVASFGPSPVYRILVEGGGQQKALTQILVHEGFNAEEVSPQGNSKQVRLSILRKPMQDGIILFPKNGMEEAESQILGFGTQKHDDLVDALTLLALKMPELKSELGSEVISISAKGFYEGRRSRFASDDDDDWGESGGNGFPRIGRPSSWRNILPG